MGKKITIIVFVLITCLLYCGKKGPLKLEPEILPVKPPMFTLSQVGENLRLLWEFPRKMSDNKTDLDLDKVSKIEIFYSPTEIKDGKFKRKSKILRKLNMTDLKPYSDPRRRQYVKLMTQAQQRKTNRLVYYVDIPFTIETLNNKVHYLALRYSVGRKKTEITDVKAIHTRTPLKPIEGITITQENKIIKLKWNKPEKDVLGADVNSITGYNVYRKVKGKKRDQEEEGPVDVEEMEFLKINIDNVLEESFEDADTAVDGQYDYYVTTSYSGEIESAPSGSVSVTYSDQFAPDVPVNLVVFKTGNSMLLSWKPVPDKDLSHYRVYRKTDEDAEFTLLADKIDTLRYKDENLKQGVTYYYAVTAVDVRNNESAYSNTVKEEH